MIWKTYRLSNRAHAFAEESGLSYCKFVCWNRAALREWAPKIERKCWLCLQSIARSGGKFSGFERAFLKWAIEEGENFFADETCGVSIRPLLEAEGLLRRESYDPKKHGEGVDADRGDPIWSWTDKAYARAGMEPT